MWLIKLGNKSEKFNESTHKNKVIKKFVFTQCLKF